VLLLLGVGALVFGASREPSLTMLAFCALSAVLGGLGLALWVWGVGYRRLVYALTESAVRIDWIDRILVLPYDAVQGIYAGQRLAGNATPSVPCWPGINIGSRWVRGMGRLRFYTTSSDQADLTYITVEHDGGVIVSAREPVEFQTALIAHIERFDELATDSEGERATLHTREPERVPWTALADIWLPVCVAAGTLVLLLVLAIIVVRYEALPDQVALHFDVGGQPSQIAPKSDLVRLPLLGLLCLGANWVLGVLVHAREQVLARLLWLVAVIMQLVLLIGVVRMVV